VNNPPEMDLSYKQPIITAETGMFS